PWIRTHNLAPRSRVDLKRTYASYRNSAWAGGTEPAGAGRGFGSQVDVAALFIERSIDLLRPDGMCGLIVPSKLWRSLAGGGVRDFLTTHASIRELHDLSEAPLMFDAAVYPSILVAGHSTKGTGMRVRSTSLVVHRDDRASRWCAEATNLRLNNSAGSPWLLLPSEARGAFDRVVDAGTPFFRTTFGRPLLGVKTGCNDAFIVKNGQANIESDLLRPLLRGDRVSQWKVNPGDARIIWTHDDHGQPLSALPPLAATFLRKRRLDLARRSDAAGHHTWWMLFRTESANSSLPRVVWSDIGRRPRAAVLKAGDRTVALNSCYVARCPTLLDAYALAALLNSVLAAAWLSVIAEPARGNYRRYLGWTMSILPLPRAWTRARSILAPIGVSAAGGEEPSPEELLEATLDAYELRRAEVAPLLAWAE
ncbi:MAG TPA: hypothetical protein VHM24_04155, partial [Gemmatimonadaceae bacterium]|nr:hypothetical protein [Gemmatimonadaceae bacterium]